jgi:hypothetical protein
MARRINEQYHALRTKDTQIRENTKFFTAEADAMLVAVEAELAAMSPEPAEGFNAIGFLGCLLTTQEGGSFGIC